MFSSNLDLEHRRVLEPTAYRRWYETPLGRRVDADEKALVFRLADLERGELVLDVGCGDANYTGPAAEHTGRAIGLDRSPEMLRAAEVRLRAVAGLRWVEGDATALPFHEAHHGYRSRLWTTKRSGRSNERASGRDGVGRRGDRSGTRRSVRSSIARDACLAGRR